MKFDGIVDFSLVRDRFAICKAMGVIQLVFHISLFFVYFLLIL